MVKIGKDVFINHTFFKLSVWNFFIKLTLNARGFLRNLIFFQNVCLQTFLFGSCGTVWG